MPTRDRTLGSLWPDREDALQLLGEKARTGQCSPSDVARLDHWMAHGWAVVEGAVDAASIDTYVREFEELIAHPSPNVLLFSNVSGGPAPLRPEHITPETSPKVLDHHVWSEAARHVLFSPGIIKFLHLLFEQPALLFQSLGFEYGSQQGIHQDTAYVVVEPPLDFVGVWIALEDIEAGTGELEYLDRSHRIPHHLFGGERKHWRADIDGPEGHTRWLQHVHGHAGEMRLEKLKFRAPKGSALFWHADLAHGGSPIEIPGATRRSVVGHYCPVSAAPHYFRAIPERAVTRSWQGDFYSTYYYALPEPSGPVRLDGDVLAAGVDADADH